MLKRSKFAEADDAMNTATKKRPKRGWKKEREAHHLRLEAHFMGYDELAGCDDLVQLRAMQNRHRTETVHHEGFALHIHREILFAENCTAQNECTQAHVPRISAHASIRVENPLSTAHAEAGGQYAIRPQPPFCYMPVEILRANQTLANAVYKCSLERSNYEFMNHGDASLNEICQWTREDLAVTGVPQDTVSRANECLDDYLRDDVFRMHDRIERYLATAPLHDTGK